MLWVTEMAKSKTADKGDSCPAHPRAVFWKRLYYTLISKRRAQHNGRDTVVDKNIAELWAGKLGRKRKTECLRLKGVNTNSDR